MIEQQASNVVVIPLNARVDLFQQMWLVKHGLLEEEATGFFTPVAVQASDANCEILIMPNRVQIAGKGDLDAAVEAATKRMSALITQAGSALSPFSGCGLNFQWVLRVEEAALPSLERLFFCENPLFNAMSDARDAMFSVTERRDDVKVTTKLDYGRNKETGLTGIMVDLNFHSDAADADGVVEFIGRSAQIKALALERVSVIAEFLFPGGAK